MLDTNPVKIEIAPIGVVESSLTDAGSAPRQPDEGAPPATLVFNAEVGEGLQGVQPGDSIYVLTWLDRARRDLLTVHPRGDRTRPREGVFNTRAPHRPNPIGLHRTTVTAVEGLRVRVANLEALNGTPIVDVKPMLNEDVGQR